MAPTILSQKARRAAPPDLSVASIDFLIRERGILELARQGFSRDEAKRVIFLAWLARRRDLEAV